MISPVSMKYSNFQCLINNICAEENLVNSQSDPSVRDIKIEYHPDTNRVPDFIPLKTKGPGAPALESRTEGRLVSPTTAAEKKNCTPTSVVPGFAIHQYVLLHTSVLL